MTLSPMTKLRTLAPYQKSAFVLVGVFLFAILVCFGLATREPDYPPNDGVIELPVEGMGSAFVGEYGEALIEPEGGLSLPDLATRSDWVRLHTRYIGFGAISKPIWIRVALENTTNKPITIRIDTRRVAFKQMQMFLTGDRGETQRKILDYTYEAPFSARPVNHRILVVDTELAPKETTMLYVRYRGIYNSVLPIRVAKPEAFERADKYELFWASLFYGLLGATFFLTILTWWLTGWRLSMSFGFFLLSSLLSIWSVEGYVDQLLIPTKTAMTARLTDTIYLINYGAILLISRNIFDLKHKAPWLDRISIWGIVIIFALALFHFFIGISSREVFVPLALSARVASLALHAAVGIWAVLNREKGGSVFALSAVLLTIASAYMVTDETFGYPYGGIPFTLRWLITIEIIAFATAIAQHVLGIRQERDAALKADLKATRERLRLNEALQESQSAYQLAQERASDLRHRLHSVSHDILQPLSSLKSAVVSADPASLENGQALSDAFEYLEALATENLPGQVGHHTEVSAKDKAPLSLVLDSIVTMFADDAAQKGIALDWDRDISEPCLVDPVLTMRAISNLVSNSIRHTDEGAVRLSVQAENAVITIKVVDTGKGMTAHECSAFLEEGVKGEGSTGSGLGLGIVRNAVAQLGGTFELHSEIGVGTTALLTIPAGPEDCL